MIAEATRFKRCIVRIDRSQTNDELEEAFFHLCDAAENLTTYLWFACNTSGHRNLMEIDGLHEYDVTAICSDATHGDHNGHLDQEAAINCAKARGWNATGQVQPIIGFCIHPI
jgi:hypothetical protein